MDGWEETVATNMWREHETPWGTAPQSAPGQIVLGPSSAWRPAKKCRWFLGQRAVLFRKQLPKASKAANTSTQTGLTRHFRPHVRLKRPPNGYKTPPASGQLLYQGPWTTPQPCQTTNAAALRCTSSLGTDNWPATSLQPRGRLAVVPVARLLHPTSRHGSACTG